jgi:hypothetical protein
MNRNRNLLRRSRLADDAGSLAFAMLLTLIAVSMTALMLPVVVGEFRATRIQMHRDDSLNAAQAGLDVALGRIRSVRDVNGDGTADIGELPCGTLRGTVAGVADAAAYEVTITYNVPDAAGVVTPTVGCPFGASTAKPA